MPDGIAINKQPGKFRPATTSDILEAARHLDYAVGNQYCYDHKLAWTDGGDCWAAGINGIDACRIIAAAAVRAFLDHEAATCEHGAIHRRCWELNCDGGAFLDHEETR